jgi:HAD superfamily hydrolase (TIGR01509 family)
VTDRYDAIFFDNDGVLVDTEPLFLQATQEVLGEIGVEVTADLYHEMSMRQGRSVFELVAERGHSREEIFELRAVRGRRYDELIRAGVRVLDGVAATMDALAGVRPTAIVTSSTRDHFDAIHVQTGLEPYFEFVLTDGDYAHHKPHPAPYLTAAERMRVDPARCLVIEDTERGLVSAREAGMDCAVIPNALTAGADFSRATIQLDSMTELPGWLGLR